jgi:putative ABC transport system substrate-binding protein
MIGRRDFTLLGGAVAWPLAAWAQQARRLPTIGFLGSGTTAALGGWTAAFVKRLRELGWIEGRTVAIEYRWAEGRNERSAEFAAEFVRLNVDAIRRQDLEIAEQLEPHLEHEDVVVVVFHVKHFGHDAA